MGMSPHEWAYFGLLATLQGGLKIKDPGTTKTIPIQKNFGVCPLTIAAASETRSLVTASKVGVGTRLVVVADQITGSGNCTVNGHYFANEGEWVEFQCLQYNGANAWVATGNYGATPLEITRVADVSSRSIAAGSSETYAVKTHESRTILLDTAAGSAVTLSEGILGARLRIVTSVKSTGSPFHVITATSAIFVGSIAIHDRDGTTANFYNANGTTNNIITLNGTTSGGLVGDWLDLECIIEDATSYWAVDGQLSCAAGSNPATPFSG